MEIENEHLTEIPHFGVLRVRSKSGEVFCLDAVALDGEGIHQHRTEAPFVGIVAKSDMVVELAVLQRLAQWLLSRVVTSLNNCQPLYMPNLIGNEHNGFEIRIALPKLVFVNYSLVSTILMT